MSDQTNERAFETHVEETLLGASGWIGFQRCQAGYARGFEMLRSLGGRRVLARQRVRQPFQDQS